MVRMLRDSSAIRTCLAALLSIAVCGAARAEGLDPRDGTIGPSPWMETALSPAFAAEDAYVFHDLAGPARLDADAFAVAVQRDLDRLASPSARTQHAGRIAAAFADFVSYGGSAYASIGFTLGARPAAVADVPTFSPSRLAMLAPPL